MKSAVLIPAIRAAGVLHVVVAAANFVLPGILDYRGNLARMTPILRQIFRVHAFYIVLVLLGFAAICLCYPADLRATGGLGRFVCEFLALFWSVRVVIQLGFYDRETIRNHRWGHIFFSAVFFYFAAVFLTAAFLPR